MTPPRLALALGFVLALATACCARCEPRGPAGPPRVPAAVAAPPAPAPAETVRALRYPTYVVESALEASHGGGRWIDELYFPDRGVVANVVEEYAWDEKGNFVPHARMNAFFGAIRNHFHGLPYEQLHDAKIDVEQPTEEIRVPRATAERIFALAELTKRLKEESLGLGQAAVDAGILRTRVEGKP